MKLLRLMLAILTISVIAGVVLYETEQGLGPGPLHPAHAQLEGLASGDCAQCHHPDGAGRVAESCASCHEEISAQLEARAGLHGSLEPGLSRDCGRCHVEHHGAEIALVSAHAFALAGVEDRESYDHRHVTSFDLHGAHESLRCERCHRHADDVVLATDTHRFLGQPAAADCAGCHEDIHEGDNGSDCARCHGQIQPFAQVGEFRHRRFEIDGEHAGLRCVDCHEPGSEHGINLLQSVDPTPRSCQQCHPTPHESGGDALPIAGISTDCASCHDTLGFARSFDATDHQAIGVDLFGAHARAGCSACHTPERLSRGRVTAAMERCARCHESPHDSGFLTEVVRSSGRRVDEESNCSLCHENSDLPFSESSIGPDLHAATGFPLSSPHDGLDCRECHLDSAATESPGSQALGFAQRFPGRNARDCASCHEDPHAGQFDRGPTEGRCIECHEPSHFVPPMFDVGRHAECGFPLDGSHAAVSCNRCHEASAEPGQGRRFVGTPTRCDACHTDVHRGAFDRAGVPPTVAGRMGCARCHDTGSFRNVAASFDHQRFTGYPLTGAHASASCADCHGRSTDPGRGGRSLGPAPTSCASCHDDPHAGQFAPVRSGVVQQTDCARCHTPELDFRSLSFDHDRDTSFALDEDHASLSCSTCHRPHRTSSGREVVRYRPLGTSCTDCHGGTNGQGPPKRIGGGRDR